MDVESGNQSTGSLSTCRYSLIEWNPALLSPKNTLYVSLGRSTEGEENVTMLNMIERLSILYLLEYSA